MGLPLFKPNAVIERDDVDDMLMVIMISLLLSPLSINVKHLNDLRMEFSRRGKYKR